uniref:RNA-directed DNA polymerase, eukaryota n=1 Tax=Tanacetum cinerariifolium TaxID=118510 RepID=A0A6L2P9U1_TANCI|nr:RNA-directed DNA polymerase, eukaryota [Tanacetum cinerariifolium]
MKYLKEKISAWIKVKKDSLKNIKKTLKAELAEIGLLLDKGEGNFDILNKCMSVSKSLHDLDKLELMEMDQKAKNEWATEEDENSKYYHGILNKKRSQLAICGMVYGTIITAWVFIPPLYGVFKNHIRHMAGLPPRAQRHLWLRISDTELGLDIADTLCFQLGGARHSMTWRHFILALGVHTTEEMVGDGFEAYWVGVAPSQTLIRNPLRRLCHRFISFSISGRAQAPEKVIVTDLFYLRSMDEGMANVPYMLAKYLFRHAEGRKREARMSEPPLAAAQSRTMLQRMARLEDEVHRLRESLDEQRKVIDTMAKDFSMFTVWAVRESGANERPPMHEKGNYIPWESRIKRFLDNKLEERERMWNSIQNGPYVRPMIRDPDGAVNINGTVKQIESLSKMTKGNKKQYIADVKVMNYLLQAIVDACKNAKEMWERIRG